MIPITKPFLPPLSEYENYIRQIWDNCWLTNNGPFTQELEKRLRKYLEVDNLRYVTNGTMALQLAIKALGLKGKIITTPFSFVATATSILWEGCTPVFVDIDEHTLNINPALIEQAISKNTSAILATHVFGNPCDVETIAYIAKKYNLKIIYDAAHCFGSLYNGQSVLSYGDISTISFHATKVFHTIEGGAVISNSNDIDKKISYLRNFGHDGPYKFSGIGINGKNSEVHSAMGLTNLKYIDTILKKRRADYETYRSLLSNSNLSFQLINERGESNYSYFPIIFSSESECLIAIEELQKSNIYPRRYFFPSLSQLSYTNQVEQFVANDISSRIICLPSYHDLQVEDIHKTCSIITSCLNN